MNVNDILEKPELMENLTEKQIKKLSYGIKFFDMHTAYTAWGNTPPANSNETLKKLQAILDQTK